MNKRLVFWVFPLTFTLAGGGAGIAATAIPTDGAAPEFFPVPLKVGASLTYDLFREGDPQQPDQLLGKRTIKVERLDKSGASVVASVRQVDLDAAGQTRADNRYQFAKTADWVVAAGGGDKTKLFPVPLKSTSFLEPCSSVSDLPNGNREGRSDKRWSILDGFSLSSDAGSFDCTLVTSLYLMNSQYRMGTYKPRPDWEGTIESTRSVELLVNSPIGIVEMRTTDEKFGKGQSSFATLTSLVYRIATYSIPVTKE